MVGSGGEWWGMAGSLVSILLDRAMNQQHRARPELKGTFWPEIFFLATSQKLTPKFSAFFVVFVGKEITINIVQN